MTTTLASGSHTHALPPVTVKDFGAKVDGVSDDSAFIMASIKALGVANIPAGSCVTSPLAIPAGTTICGPSHGGTVTAKASAAAELKLRPGSTGPLISPDDSGGIAAYVTIRDLALNANGIAQPYVNIPDRSASVGRAWTLERVYTYGISGSATGVYLGLGSVQCRMRDCVIYGGATPGSERGGTGVSWRGSDGIAENLWVALWGGVGFELGGGTADMSFVWRGGGTYWNQYGISVGGRGGVFDCVSIDHNYHDGVYAGYPASFIGSSFHTNSIAVNNQNSNIRASFTGPLVMLGCRAGPHDPVTSNIVAYHINADSSVNLTDVGTIVGDGVTFGTGYKRP